MQQRTRSILIIKDPGSHSLVIPDSFVAYRDCNYQTVMSSKKCVAALGGGGGGRTTKKRKQQQLRDYSGCPPNRSIIVTYYLGSGDSSVVRAPDV